MEEKTFTRIVISFFVILSFIFSYYMGYFSARLGMTPLGVSTQGNNQQTGQAPQTEEKNIDVISYQELNGSELTIGDKNSKIQFIVFNDFECPFCARFENTLTQLKEKNKDVMFATKHLPLPFHQNAKPFATIFECIGKNRNSEEAYKFAEDHFAVIRNEREITLEKSVSIAEKYGVNEASFKACSDDETIKNKINNDLNLATKLGLNGTPAIIIQNTETKNAIRIFGALPEQIIQSEIDKLR
jgi:protein-disulfide isomerase